jgi:protein-disulfide isomerase
VVNWVKASVLVLLLAWTVPVSAQEIRPDDKILGKIDAPIAIVEYASLTCSHCASFHNDVLPQIKKDWIDTGKARLVFRDFPLDGLALGAAIIAHCAPEGRYFPLLGAMFETQGQWARARDPREELKKLARLSGVTDQQVEACLADQSKLQKIRTQQQADAEKYKIESTPSFLVNGKLVSGTIPYDQFKKLLEDASKK